MKNNRKVAILLVALVSFFVVFSAFFVVREADHSCSGDSCPICYQMSVCESTTKSIAGAGVIAAIAMAFALVLFIQLFYDTYIERKQSLFARRVKLSI